MTQSCEFGGYSLKIKFEVDTNQVEMLNLTTLFLCFAQKKFEQKENQEIQ